MECPLLADANTYVADEVEEIIESSESFEESSSSSFETTTETTTVTEVEYYDADGNVIDADVLEIPV